MRGEYLQEVNFSHESEGLLDPLMAGQLMLSLRVVAEAQTLPSRVVDYHVALLTYWGLLEDPDYQLDKSDII